MTSDMLLSKRYKVVRSDCGTVLDIVHPVVPSQVPAHRQQASLEMGQGRQLMIELGTPGNF